MMKLSKIKQNIIKTFLGISIIILIVSCNTETSNNKEITTDIPESNTSQPGSVNNPYLIMQQKCFICHKETPNPGERSTMLAPPMLRVKEHYKPKFQNKEEFVNAITNYVINPAAEKALMPGAVRKFKIMPKLGYSEEDVRRIAELLYNMDLGTMPKMNMEKGELSLNNGEKWKLGIEDFSKTEKVIERLKSFNSDKLEDYNKLGADIFNVAKTVLLNPHYEGEILNQIHYFFGAAEDNIHKLEEVKNIDKAKEIVKDLNTHFSKFNTYFKER